MTSSTSCAAPSTEAPHRRRRIWGRRAGPKLRPGRKDALKEGLARFGFALPDEGGLDLGALFGAAPPAGIWLEIGFGGGEHLLDLAARNPGAGLIGVEPYLGGVGKLLAGCLAAGLTNVRVLVDDARLLLQALPDASLARVYVLFPDPWPKLRHAKRRIVNPETAALMARVLRPGGELWAATDIEAYAEAMIQALLGTPGLQPIGPDLEGREVRPADRPVTRYEAKALAAGRRPVHLGFVRRP